MNIQVRRKWYTEKSTIGEMWIDGQFECFTLELPWHDNQHGISCVPGGQTYDVTFYVSPHLGYLVPLLENVPNRTDIEIHIANRPEDIRGCTGVGLGRATDWISDSRKAFAKLMVLLRSTDEKIYITYLDNFPGPDVDSEIAA